MNYLIERSKLDEAWLRARYVEPGGSLHYLDAANNIRDLLAAIEADAKQVLDSSSGKQVELEKQEPVRINLMNYDTHIDFTDISQVAKNLESGECRLSVRADGSYQLTKIATPVAQQDAQHPGDIRALKHRVHELEGEIIGYKRILEQQDAQRTEVGNAQSLTDDLMDCVDRLGSEAETVDKRVWDHLRVYVPADSNLPCDCTLTQPLTQADLKQVKLLCFEQETNAEGEAQEAVNLDQLMLAAVQRFIEKNEAKRGGS